MIKRLGEEEIRRIHKLEDDINIYKEALHKTTPSIDIMFTSDHRSLNQISFLLMYYSNRNNKKALKEIKKILDENTTVEAVPEKTYPGQAPRFSYKFTWFKFSEELKQRIDKIYKEATKSIGRER